MRRRDDCTDRGLFTIVSSFFAQQETAPDILLLNEKVKGLQIYYASTVLFTVTVTITDTLLF